MRQRILLFGVFASLTACVSTAEPTPNGTSLSIKESELQEEVNRLNEELATKDSLINNSLSLFSEIEANLMLINHKKAEINALTSDEIMTQEEIKDRIILELNDIRMIQESNMNRIDRLNKQLADQKDENRKLVGHIEQLQNRIIEKEFEVSELASQIAAMEEGYAELEEEYMAQLELTADMQEELNKAFYVVGNQKELKEAEVIERKGGLLGMGKVSRIRPDFNKQSFTKIDLTEYTTLQIPYAKVNIISDHRTGSYELTSNGTTHTLKIISPRDFWSITKFLVVEVK